MDEIDNPEPTKQKNESPKAFRRRYAEWKGLGVRKKGSAKAQNMRDRPDKAASGICLSCGHNRLKCICSGHMSEKAHKRYIEGQKVPTFNPDMPLSYEKNNPFKHIKKDD